MRIVDPYRRDLFDLFERIDDDRNGFLSYEEFITFFNFPDSKLMQRVFRMFDTNEAGEIPFGDFVAQLWNIASRTDDSLLRFVFDIYDQDDNGFLVDKELESFIVLVHGQEAVTKDGRQWRELVKKADTNCDGMMSFEELAVFGRKNPKFFEFFHNLRASMKNNCCGADYWEQITDWRIREFGEFSKMHHILGAEKRRKSKYKAAKKEDKMRDLEEKRIEMMREQAKRAQEVVARCRLITKRQNILFIVAQARKEVGIRAQQDPNVGDVEKTKLMAEVATITVHLEDINKVHSEIWEKEFEREEKRAEKQAYASVARFLGTAVGEAIVNDGARKLLDKEKAERNTAGKRLNKQGAKDLIASKLSDKMFSSVQDQLDADFARMREMRHEEELTFIKEVKKLPDRHLAKLTEGNTALLASILKWSVDQVESEKGPWLEKEFAPVQHKKAIQWQRTGFQTSDVKEYEREALKKSAYVHQMPLCPVCGTPASKPSGVICRKDGSVLWIRSWDVSKECLFYRNCQTHKEQYESPFDPAIEEMFLNKYRAEDNDEVGGFTTRDPDRTLVALTDAREENNNALKSWA